MWFWWLMLGCDILVPVIMILSGRMMRKHPPEHINQHFGYRTARSMKNKDTWIYAHDHCGRLWWKTGWIMLIPSILLPVFVYGKTAEIVGIFGLILVTVQTMVLVGSMVPTERALKRTFDDAGLRL